jgi:hypothetical protein
MRVTKLPSFKNQFGEDNNTFAGVRQSRLGVKASTPTSLGELKTTFEFERSARASTKARPRSACATRRRARSLGAGQ